MSSTPTVPAEAAAKEAALKRLLQEYGPMAIAYSGGVDSAYLAAVAHEAIGPDARLVLADSPSMPRSELREACELAEREGWALTVVQTSEFEQEEFLRNDGTRCFYCKDELFKQMDHFAKEQGIAVLAYGEIADDALDPTRYGAKAARNHKVVAPLAEAGLFKADIRALSQARSLPTWNKASFACLSSRFPTGTRVNPAEMSKVERAEEALKQFGFRQYRARHHGDLVRVEVDEDELDRFADPTLRKHVLAALKEAGYRHITLDLAGYRTGSTAD